MPAFQPPDVNVHVSFLAGMAEFQAEGRGSDADDSMVGSEIRTWSARWHDPAVFAEYTATLRADALEETPRPGACHLRPGQRRFTPHHREQRRGVRGRT